MPYNSDVRNIVQAGNREFSRRTALLALWQEIAEHFYPERADFTNKRSIGDEYASHLMNSYPVMARRELGNMFAAFLRPRSAPWFALRAADDDRDKDLEARRWLEWATGVQWRATYDPVASFARATKEADHDFAAFGQAVLSVETNADRDALLYRNHHIRDCVWMEDAAGKVATIHRKWCPTASQLNELFPKTIDQKIKKALDKEPFKEIKCRHIVVKKSMYDLSKGKNLGYTSIYIDEENETILEETPIGWFPYVVPRWQTVSGSQYARSPATEIVLPDARLFQAINRVLLESGEKAVDPPMVAVQDALRSDVNLFAGGITTVDIEYDERTGEALRPVMDNSRGMPLGIDLADRIKMGIAEGFFLNKLNLPEFKQATTAFQVRKTVEEYIRAATPIFEPIEEEYNAALCNTTFEVLRMNGAFGSAQNVPESLRGADVRFSFKSPLRETGDEMKAQQLQQGFQLLTQIAAVDPSEMANANLTPAVRDALRGMGWQAEWFAPIEAVMQAKEAAAKQAQMAQGTQAIAAGGDIASKFGAAAKQFAQAGVTV